MQLSVFLKNHATLSLTDDPDISGLALDSRAVKPGDVFLALKGEKQEGSRFIDEAISKGAIAILTEEEVSAPCSVPLIFIPHLREKAGILAARFYDHPAKKCRMIGVTGTNGKTSCAHFIAEVLQSCGEVTGLIGTLGSGFYGALQDVSLTTPDAISLQKKLSEFAKAHAKAVVMEVSSHGIHQGRVNGIEYEMGVFTNLTQDHLDYHGSMEAYSRVKRRFLAECLTQHAIINADDPYGLTFIHELASQKSVFAYGTKDQGLPLSIPYTQASQIVLSLSGISAQIDSPWGSGALHLPLVGAFNLSNALAAFNALCLYGIPFETVLHQLAKITAVPGRMQTLRYRGQPMVVVDYAHTPDALDKALKALRAHTDGRLITVFGCGGNRDADKRPLMATVAEQWSDEVIVTNDNPRHEVPETIAADIMRGFAHPEKVSVALDRSKAIQKSIQCAKENDCILIAGKGAERYQQMGNERIPFDDVSMATHFLKTES